MFSRGAIWRKWDLHVHTPASYQWKGKRLDAVVGAERDALLDQVLDGMSAVDTAVFGIMDYWTFDGYWALRKRIDARVGGTFSKTLFPGMELRCEAPADYRLNIHVLLSDKLSEQKLLNFKSALRLTHVDEPLSDEGLANVARQLSSDKLSKQGIDAAKVATDDAYATRAGSKVAVIKRESLYDAVSRMPKGTALIMAPWDPYNGVAKLNADDHAVVVSEIMNQMDVWESRRSFFVDLFAGRETAKNKRFIEHFFESIGNVPRPAVSGSDAHKTGEYGGSSTGADGEKRWTWIKADPTYWGLRQILHEPVSRVHIGTKPAELRAVEEEPTRYIESVKVWKEPSSLLAEEWFDCDLPLNPYLVAIIGNKGSGKSALLDILGLLGQSQAAGNFSFLNRERFRHPKNNKAIHFRASLKWCDGEVTELGLGDVVPAGSVERVKYVPQSYLESVCNEVDLGVGGGFRKELEAVIFSHVPLEDRLGYASLAELLEHKVRETDDRLRILRDELSGINIRVVALESQSTPEKRVDLVANVAEQQRLLAAIDAQKPVEVLSPENTVETEESKAVRMALAEAATLVENLEVEVQMERTRLVDLARRMDLSRQASEQLANLELFFRSSRERLEPILTELGTAFEDVVTLEIDRAKLNQIQMASESESAAVNARLALDSDTSVLGRLEAARKALQVLRGKLEGPAKEYQEYLRVHARWAARRIAHVGTAETEGTLAYALAAVEKLKAIPHELKVARELRRKKIREIFSELFALRQAYQALYAPVQLFAEKHELLAERFRPEFTVTLETTRFADTMLSFIARNKSGTFYGEGAESTLRALLEKFDLDSEHGVIGFVDEVLDCFAFDKRGVSPANEPRRVAEQLKGNVKVHELYDFVAGLTFLQPQYQLRLHGKSLAELSPGERGTLLLMFYLLVDRSRCPLLIDQPEENLDNQTVFSLVGQCIREAKRRRQVIMVTHNPNLAVACDAEQLVFASRENDGTNRVEYSSGSIEAPRINEAVLDVLEGTRPAFDNRESKYHRSLGRKR